MSFKVVIGIDTSLPPMPKIVDQFTALIQAANREAVANYKRRMINWALQDINVPRATGNLQQSVVNVITQSNATGLNFELFFGSDADYAIMVDEGTPPHFPPVARIQAWCITKGIPIEAAWAIAVHISKHGTRAQAWIDDGMMFAKQVGEQEFRNSYARYGITNMNLAGITV